MAHWVEYFEQLFNVNPLSGQFETTWLQVMDANPLINEIVPSLDEVNEAVVKLRKSSWHL